jgi:tetratricopeptide (TPR) repeat protein
MKPIAVIFVSLLAAGAASFAVCQFSECTDRSAPTAQEPDAALAAALDRLTAQQAKLERELAELRNATPLSEPDNARIPLGEIEAAVARALDARSQTALTAASTSAAMLDAAPKKFEPRAAFDRVSGLDWDDAQAVWKEIADEGGLDAVLAMFEANAKADPNDPKAQVALGHAYLQKLFHAGAGPEAGVWAMKADSAFDSALKLDDRNWSARFSKAMSLSHWPPVFGKQTEAIKHFEILVAQQQGVPQQDDFADTHFLLGNMYQQMGDRDRALAAWQQGLSLFPDNAQLAQQIANLSAH